ncbi:MAG: hypothetical protein M3Q68_01270 [Actinomycetota bacterium]|nr:hypothetical protein [Actinomycetota bacterium]
MEDPRPELSSVSTALDELTKRLSTMADASIGAEQDISVELFEIERSLRGAQRRLHKLLTGSRR